MVGQKSEKTLPVSVRKAETSEFNAALSRKKLLNHIINLWILQNVWNMHQEESLLITMIINVNSQYDWEIIKIAGKFK